MKTFVDIVLKIFSICLLVGCQMKNGNRIPLTQCLSRKSMNRWLFPKDQGFVSNIIEYFLDNYYLICVSEL